MLRSNHLLTIFVLLALLVSACQPIIVPAASNADSAPIAQRLQAAYSAGDMAGLTDILAPDAIVHMPPLPDIIGIDAYRAAIADLRNALPNATLTFNAVTATSAQIVAQYTITGTHTGPSVAFGPPTGKAATFTGVMVAQTQNGQISELWDYADRFGLSLQVEQALPPPPTYVAVNEPAPAANPNNLDPALAAEVEALINQVMTEQRQIGMAIGIVMNGEVAYARGFGVADVESGRPMTERSLVEQGSVSKQFVGTAMMQLVEQGKLKLDDPLVKYLPYFQIKDTRAGEITLRHILTHLSGIVTPESPSMEAFARALVPEYDAASYERMVRRLGDTELLYDPGQGPFTYSDLAYNILGAVISEVSGQPFEDYMRDHIFLPLGMNDTTFELRATDPTLLARPHVTGADGKIGKANLFPYTRSNAPSSYLYISVADMARWMALNLHQGALDGVQILQPATHQEMWRPQVVDTGLGEFISAWTSYGIGMFMGDLFGEPVKGAGGTDLGYISYQLIFPEKNMGIVIMANRVDTIDEAFALVPVFEGVMAKIAGIAPAE